MTLNNKLPSKPHDLILSYLILSYLILSYLILSYLILSYDEQVYKTRIGRHE